MGCNVTKPQNYATNCFLYWNSNYKTQRGIFYYIILYYKV